MSKLMQRGKRMAEMQIAVRARREAEDGVGHARAERVASEGRLRRHDICRCFAPVMSFFIHTEADLDTAIARLDRRRSALRHGAVAGRAAAAAAAAGRVRRPRLDRGLAAALDRQRRARSGDGSTAAFDPLDHAAVLRARAGQARARRAVGAEDPHAQGDRQGASTAASSIFRARSTCRPTRRTPR